MAKDIGFNRNKLKASGKQQPKKKKKDGDFQKVKLKVGRKLAKGLNETRTDFKVKKVVLREAKVLSEEPISALLSCSQSNTQMKILCLAKVGEGCLVNNPKLITGQVICQFGRYLLDDDSRVRVQANKCIRQSVLSLKEANIDTEEFVTLLVNFLKCGLTHIDRDIIKQARETVSFLIEEVGTGSLDKLLDIIVESRFIEGLQPEPMDYEFCAEILLRKSQENNKKYAEKNYQWSTENNRFPLTNFVYSLEYDMTFKSTPFEKADTLAIDKISKTIQKEVKRMAENGNGHWSLSYNEARLFLATAKIHSLLELPKYPLKAFHGFSLVGSNDKKKGTANLQANLNKHIRLLFEISQL